MNESLLCFADTDDSEQDPMDVLLEAGFSVSDASLALVESGGDLQTAFLSLTTVEEQPEAKKKSRRAKNKKGAKDSDEEKGTPLPVPKDPVQPKRRGKKKAKRDDSEDEVDSKQELVEVAQPKSCKEKR